jgi:hypothetical protein
MNTIYVKVFRWKKINMMKDGNSISITEQNRRGCLGCKHYVIIPEQLVEFCDLSANKCTYGEADDE